MHESPREMLVLNFTGGQTPSKSGLGLTGLPGILVSLANRGHRVVLFMGGLPTPGKEKFQVPDFQRALKRKEGNGSFGIVCFKAWTKWSFSPVLLWKIHKAIRAADMICLHSLYCFPVLAGYLLARLHCKPYSVWIHGALAPFQRRVSAGKKRLYERLIARRILDEASVLVYTAQSERDEANDFGIKAPSVIIPLGMDSHKFEELPPAGRFRSCFFPGRTGPLVFHLGRLNGKKGLDLLVQAMALVIAQRPETLLAIVGPADPRSFEQQVCDWVRDSGIQSNTVITGAVSTEQKRNLFTDADVFVSSSQAENFGYSIFEAMASRIPVVVSDTLNYACEIAEERAGFSVARDPKSFADAILCLIEQPVLRQQCGEKGIGLARSYSWARHGLAMEKMIVSVVERSSMPSELTQERPR